MESNIKTMNALNYLSVFFAPFLFPLIVYFVAKDKNVKYHAKRAFLSHLVTVVLGVLLIVIYLFTFLNTPENLLSTPMLILLLAGILFFMLTCAYIFIWNIFQAVKVAK